MQIGKPKNDRRHVTITDPTGQERRKNLCLTVYNLTSEEIARALKELHERRQAEKREHQVA